MATQETTTPIRRHVVVVDGTDIVASARSRDKARTLARRESALPYRARQTVGIREYLLYPNAAIVAFGVDRFDTMLTGVHSNGITITGSLEELIQCGAIGTYIRDELGKSGCKSSCDEYGNKYRLEKRAKGRYELYLHFSHEPQKPHANAFRQLGVPKSPDEIDIFDVLAGIAGCRRTPATDAPN